MKRIVLFSFWGLALSSWASGQSNSTTEPSAPAPSASPASAAIPLTPAEEQEINQAHGAALLAHPDLAAEERSLWGKIKAARDTGNRPGPDVMAELLSFNHKLEAAMINIDPKVKPLLARLDAAHPSHP